jgi:RNA polymerase sigma-70 factor (ECF subfamily)
MAAAFCTDLSDRELSDRELAAAAQGGDAGALDALIARFRPRILRFVMRHMRDEQEAEEVTQEALLRVFKGLHRYEGRSAFSTWVFGIARNESLFRLRTLRRRRAREVVDTVDAPVPEPDADTRIDARRRLLRCLDALEDVSPERRELLLAGTRPGPTLPELARQKGCSLPALKARQHRSRRALHARLASAPPRGA